VALGGVGHEDGFGVDFAGVAVEGDDEGFGDEDAAVRVEGDGAVGEGGLRGRLGFGAHGVDGSRGGGARRRGIAIRLRTTDDGKLNRLKSGVSPPSEF